MKQKNHLDYPLLLIPFCVICAVCATFFLWPQAATNALTLLRGFLNRWFSSWYALIGLLGIVVSLYLALSPLGKIRLGEKEKALPPFQWGAMVFTATMAADIVYYSLCEWALYAQDPYLNSLGGSIQDWAATMPLFHWGPTVWSFYLVLAAALAFMIFVRGRNTRRLSESCRPILGRHVDGIPGKIIDLLTIFNLFSLVAASFAVSIPMISQLLGNILGFQATKATDLLVNIFICLIYSAVAWFGLKAISRLSSLCVWMFLGLLAFVFFFGGRSVYILETSITALGNLCNNFLRLSTQLDPLRTTSFPQNFTIFYWAYWLGWCVGGPFFIAQISGGRTVRQVILEGYAWGLSGTWISFMILGGYSQSLQMVDGMNLSGAIAAGEPVGSVILSMLSTLPLHKLVLILVVIVMVAFHATTLDTISVISAAFCCKSLKPEELPDRKLRLFWAILLVLLPIALLFADGSFDNIQSVTILCALPISAILVLCTASFIKDGKAYLKERQTNIAP